MSNTRPYIITFNGIERMVEATSREAVTAYVAKEMISELRPARPSEVSAWALSGKPIERTDQVPPTPSAEGADSRIPGENQE